jgi:preprotein translocase subunit SecG
MKASNNTLDKLAFVGLIIFFIMCLLFAWCYNDS